LSELEWYGRCFSIHLSCHHLQSEHVEMKSMDMLKVEGTNMVKEHGHPTNHQLGEEGMKTVEEHDHPTGSG
jgi:hypothetical protein